jgi:hypothetical protein
MKLKVAQLFVRNILGCKEPNTYMVCGIIKTDRPLEVESTHLISADDVKFYETRDVREYSRGNNFDGVMQSHIWKVKI